MDLLNLAMGLSLLTSTVSTIGASDVQPILDALQVQITWANVANILVVLVGACVGFVFAWWAVRKISKALMGAFKKGKISL